MPVLTGPMPPTGQPGSATSEERLQADLAPVAASNKQQFDHVASYQIANEALMDGWLLDKQGRLQLMPREIPQEIQQQLLGVPEHEFRRLLENSINNLCLNTAATKDDQLTVGKSDSGEQNMTNHPTQALKKVQRPNNPQKQQRIRIAQHLLQQRPDIITIMDNHLFSPSILNQLIKQSPPAEINMWAKLKYWASRNPGLMGNIDSHKLHLMQLLHYQAELGRITVTPQQIQAFRAKLRPEMQGTHDNQLRNYIAHRTWEGRQR